MSDIPCIKPINIPEYKYKQSKYEMTREILIIATCICLLSMHVLPYDCAILLVIASTMTIELIRKLLIGSLTTACSPVPLFVYDTPEANKLSNICI